MLKTQTRREFARKLGLGPAILPLITNLPSIASANQLKRKKRLVVIFSPNGVVPSQFWPDAEGESFVFKEILKPLAPYRNRCLILNGISDKVRGDGDQHMRGIGCLLTGIELFPGNIQGGSDTPAGWSTGHSIDQEIRRHLQRAPETRTRLGSIEFGVMVPEKADTWTRMVYAGANQPLPPINDPYQMFTKLYGRMKDRESLKSILDNVREDLRKIEAKVSTEDRRLLDEHATFIREIEQELQETRNDLVTHALPRLEAGIKQENDNLPRISKMQIDLLVNSLSADFTRVATLQYTNSVGMARFRWLGISDAHHDLSHNPQTNKQAMDQLVQINQWFCQQIAYLAKRLEETPEPGGCGSLLDNTTIVWTNELGEGNSHSLDNIPFVLVGNGLDFRMGRSIRYQEVPHNRLLIAMAQGMGCPIERFGNRSFCGDGALTGLI